MMLIFFFEFTDSFMKPQREGIQKKIKKLENKISN